MNARDDLGYLKRGSAWGDAVERDRCLRGSGDWFLRERMRKRFEGVVVLKREMRALVGFHEHEDRRHVADFPAERDPVRVRETRCVAPPIGERCAVVEFSCHGGAENRNERLEIAAQNSRRATRAYEILVPGSPCQEMDRTDLSLSAKRRGHFAASPRSCSQIPFWVLVWTSGVDTSCLQHPRHYLHVLRLSGAAIRFMLRAWFAGTRTGTLESNSSSWHYSRSRCSCIGNECATFTSGRDDRADRSVPLNLQQRAE